jgi:3-oxoacyl-[acyl-carrier protein] reductase
MKRVALVSGSSRGIGRAVALELAVQGYIVYVNGRTEASVQKTVAEIEKSGGKALACVADFSIDSRCSATVANIVSTQGQLDLLVANLGSGKTPNVWNPSVEETRKVFDLNFFSAVALTNAALEKMKPGANIVFISSIAGCEALGAPIAYSAAKTALLSYAKTLSTLAAPKGIRVNTVSPGNVMFEGSTWDDRMKADEASLRILIQAQVPLNGFASPEDIAKAVSYLISAPFVTGHNLVVDGGQTHMII